MVTYLELWIKSCVFPYFRGTIAFGFVIRLGVIEFKVIIILCKFSLVINYDQTNILKLKS